MNVTVVIKELNVTEISCIGDLMKWNKVFTSKGTLNTTLLTIISQHINLTKYRTQNQTQKMLKLIFKLQRGWLSPSSHATIFFPTLLFHSRSLLITPFPLPSQSSFATSSWDILMVPHSNCIS